MSQTQGQFQTRTPEDLACDAQAGSMPCFVELVTLFEARVFSFVLRRVGSATDAEDLTQETFVRAFRNLGRYRRQWRFSTWLFTIATRLATDHLRRTAREKVARAAHRHEPSVGAPGRDPTMAVVDKEHGQVLWTLAGQVLSADQQAALWLRYAEDLGVKDIAAVLGKSRVAVRVMLTRARATLAQHAMPPADKPSVTPSDEQMGAEPHTAPVVARRSTRTAQMVGGT
jgi:RNA polymerase sigma-70 factor (ECF subfamily)